MLYRRFLSSCLIVAGWLSAYVAGGQVVDNSTLTGKFMLGYQAWHACQGDGAAINKYIHWGHADNARPATNDVLADIWADTAEFGPGELFSSSLVLGNGQPAKAYS